MRTLREVHTSVKVSIFMLAVIAFASLFTVLNARSAMAESFLLGTVRCLIKTVSLKECNPPLAQPTENAPNRPTAPATSPQPSSPPSSSPVAPGSQQVAPSSDGNASSNGELSPLPMPDDTLAPVSSINPVSPSEKLAYQPEGLNNLPYQGANSSVFGVEAQATTSEGVVAASSEGWRLFGIAWYWWAFLIAAVAGVTYALNRRNGKLRIR